MADANIFKNDLKTLGLIGVSAENKDEINGAFFKDYIKVLYIPAGYTLTVDLISYHTEQPSLFFIAPNQYFQLLSVVQEKGYMLFYNRDFYCIQIHDAEVSCDGLLFSNIYNSPEVSIPDNMTWAISYIFTEIRTEFNNEDHSLEEMVRTLLKQLLIKSTRIWKSQHLAKELLEHNTSLDFFRAFTILVEKFFKSKHSVMDYAELLHIAPKTITQKFKRMGLPQPNEIIKNRIILEAKRLLVHTTLTAKEVGYTLGYEDPAYFSKTFLSKTGFYPSEFRTKYSTFSTH